MGDSTNRAMVKLYLTYWLKYTLLFAIVAAGVFCWFAIAGKSFSWEEDASSQYIPKAVYFIRYMKSLYYRILEGDFTLQMYDFSIGFGDAVPFHTEPIYWLFLLFHEKNIEVAYNVLILLRLYLSGLSISLFFLYFKMGTWESLMGSMVYVFSNYGLYAGMRHSHFIVTLIMFPLLLLSIEEIYRVRRWVWCTITVAVSFWCGYYFTYMSTFFMGFYFLIRFFGGKEQRSVKIFFKKVGVIIGSYLLGIGISNLTLFNSFAGYLTSSRTTSTARETTSLLFYESPWLEKLYLSFLSPQVTPGNWVWLGFIALVYFCFLLLFFRKGNWQLKAAVILCTIFLCFPVFGYIFNGFSTVSNRWCYVCAFVAALVTAKMLPELMHLTKRELTGLGIFMLPYLFLGIGRILLGWYDNISVRDTGILLILVWLLLLWMYYKPHVSGRTKKRILTCSVVVLLWCTGAFRFSTRYAGMIDEFVNKDKVYSKSTGTPLRLLKNTSEKDPFFRSYSKESGGNVQGASMMLDYNGIVYYSSIIGKPVIDFYRELGLTSWSLVRLRGFDGRGYLNALASVRYEGVKTEKPYDLPYGYTPVEDSKYESKTYQLYETDNYLPMGYTFDRGISLEEFEKIPTEQRQEVMLQAVVVDDADAYETLEKADASDVENGNITITGTKVPITEIKCENGMVFDGHTITVLEKETEEEEDAVLTIYFEGLDNCETYLNLENLTMDNDDKRWFYLNSDSETYTLSYYYHGDNQTYTTSQEDYIFNLGYTSEGKTFCSIRISSPCEMTVDEISVYCQPMDALPALVEERSEDILENVEIGVNTVTGTIDAGKDEFLVLSIPYDAGWTAYVDGVKTKIHRGNVMFMGLPLEEGTHTIELKYETVGIRISIVITVIFIALTIAILLYQRKRRRKQLT